MSGGRKLLGYAGRRPEKAGKHAAWPGYLTTPDVHVENGSIKPRRDARQTVQP